VRARCSRTPGNREQLTRLAFRELPATASILRRPVADFETGGFAGPSARKFVIRFPKRSTLQHYAVHWFLAGDATGRLEAVRAPVRNQLAGSGRAATPRAKPGGPPAAKMSRPWKVRLTGPQEVTSLP